MVEFVFRSPYNRNEPSRLKYIYRDRVTGKSGETHGRSPNRVQGGDVPTPPQKRTMDGRRHFDCRVGKERPGFSV